MKIKLHKNQYTIATDTHRFRVAVCGRRFGKSVMSRMIALKWAIEHPGRLIWIVSPTYKTSKMIHWRDYQNEIPQSLLKKKNEVELSLELTNGSRIELRGAENPDLLRGVKLGGLIVDEVDSIRSFDWLWSEVLRPTLTDFEAPALFCGTPKGFGTLYSLFQKGQDSNSEYKSWRFTSYDNPYIPKEEIDHAKTELTEETFAQEYLADFRTFTGLAFKSWDRVIHLIDSFDVPKEWSRGRGFDYGSNDPTASVRIAIDAEDNWFVERCYKNNHSSIKDHAQSVLSQDYGLGFIPIWGDPSGDQWEREFSTYGLNIQSASKDTGQSSKGWVAFGIEKLNERLKSRPGRTVRLPNGRVIENTPSLFVLNTQENQPLVKEMELLQWKTTNTGQTLPILDESVDPDGHSDLCAALRYFAVSWSKPKKITIPDDHLFDDSGFY